MKSYLILFLLILIGFIGCTSTRVESLYGPRWCDYEEWKNLQLGMSKTEVVRTLGEPYISKVGYIAESKKYETLVFKIRVKYFKTSSLNYKKENMSSQEMVIHNEIKPEKFANTEVWGEYFDLVCEFNDDVLVGWTTIEPQLRSNEKKEAEE